MGKIYNNLITTTAGFNFPAKAPLDDREVVQSYSDLNTLVTNNQTYEGMSVYVVDDKKAYRLVGAEWRPEGEGILEPGEGENSIQQVNTEARAISDTSLAFGKNVIAGGKGFKISAVSGTVGETGTYTITPINNDKETLITKLTELSNLIKTTTLRYSVRLNNAWADVGNIQSVTIDDAKSIYQIHVDNYCGEKMDGGALDLANGVVEDYLVVIGHPELGNVEVGFYAYAEGRNTISQNIATHAEGKDTIASGQFAHAEGRQARAVGYGFHAEGRHTLAKGYASHAENGGGSATNATKAIGNYSHAEGYQTEAHGYHSHTEGANTKAHGQSSHAEGENTEASKSFAHAEGWYSRAEGSGSHAEGNHTIATGQNQHVQGRWNIADDSVTTANPYGTYAHIIGAGNAENSRENIHTVSWTGDGWYKGSVTANRLISDTINPASNGGTVVVGGPMSISGSVSATSVSATGDITSHNGSYSLRATNKKIAATHTNPENPGGGGGVNMLTSGAKAPWSIACGYHCYTLENTGSHSVCFGAELIVGSTQAAMGIFNNPYKEDGTTIDTNIAFMIGNGWSDSSRKNIFVVHKDGSIKIGNTTLTEAQLIKILNFIDTIELE